MRTTKGERGSAESVHARLLSRQGVLRCAACGRAMIVGASPAHGKTWITYRCPPVGDCTERASIMAHKVDAYVAEFMKQAQVEGTYSAGEQMAQAQAALATAQEDFRQALRNFATLKDAVEVQTILEEFRGKVDLAQTRVDDLRRAFGPSAVRSMADWDDLSLAYRRDLVRALIKSVEVRRGRGPVAERVSIQTLFE